MCIIDRSFASPDLKLQRKFNFDPVLLAYRRGFSEMAILYYFFASTGDLARFGQNRFSRPAIYFLVRLFNFNEIRDFHPNGLLTGPKELKKKKSAPTDKIWCSGGQSKSVLGGSNPPCNA